MRHEERFKKRLAERKAQLWRSAEWLPMVPLWNKSTARPYVERMNVALPGLYHDAASVADIDFAALPERVVIKPAVATNSDGVMLLDGDTDLMSGKRVDRSDLPALYSEHGRLIVEELLSDYDSRFPIPRDFKIFAAGGRVHVVQVIDRNGPPKRVCHSFYDRKWKRVPDRFKTNLTESPDIAKPPFHKDLIRAAERISRDIDVFMRLDFYMTPRGPVFGEFTPTPADGWNFTPYADKLLCELLDRHTAPLHGWSMEGRPGVLSRLRELLRNPQPTSATTSASVSPSARNFWRALPRLVARS